MRVQSNSCGPQTHSLSSGGSLMWFSRSPHVLKAAWVKRPKNFWKDRSPKSQRQKSRSTLQNGHAQPTAWICVTSYSTNISREWHSSQIQAIQMKPLQNGGAWHSSHQKSMLKCSLYCGVNGYDSVEETRSGIINHPYSDGSYHPCKCILQTLHYRTFIL